MLGKVLGRFRRRAPTGSGSGHTARSAPPAPPPPRLAAPPPPPPPPGYVAPTPDGGLRFRMMFDDGSVATSLDDPEQQEQLGYILKNLLPRD